MEITTRYHGPVAVLRLDGKLTHGEGDAKLRGAVLDVLDEGYDKILIDMGGVRRVDSSGLGELLRCRTTCQRYHADLKLLRLDPSIYTLMTVSKLVGVFDIYDSEAEALPSFWSDRSSGPGH